MLIHRFEAELIFANADLFQDDVLARVRAAEPPPGTVVLDFEAVSQVDVTGAQTLRSVHDTLETRDIRLIVARAKSTVRERCVATGSPTSSARTTSCRASTSPSRPSCPARRPPLRRPCAPRVS